MPDGITMRLEGAEGVMATLRELGSRTEERIVNKVGKEVMEPVRQALRDAAPEDEGHLKESIIVRSRVMRSGARSIRVGPSNRLFVSVERGKRKRPSNYARILEKRRPFARPVWDRFGGSSLQREFVNMARPMIEKSVRLMRRKNARKGAGRA